MRLIFLRINSIYALRILKAKTSRLLGELTIHDKLYPIYENEYM